MSADIVPLRPQRIDGEVFGCSQCSAVMLVPGRVFAPFEYLSERGWVPPNRGGPICLNCDWPEPDDAVGALAMTRRRLRGDAA